MKFSIDADQFTIQLEGLEKIWALKSRLQIPRYALADVDYIAQRPLMRDFRGHRCRVPGVRLSGMFLAGSYTHHDEREFWYIRMKTSGVLVLQLKPGTLHYDKIRLTCKPEIAQAIADWWREK